MLNPVNHGRFTGLSFELREFHPGLIILSTTLQNGDLQNHSVLFILVRQESRVKLAN
jgi:hypothetical protein